MADYDSLISFLGWVCLTYAWLEMNLTFASAICQAIQKHNDAIRQEVLQELEDDEEEEQSEDES